MNRKQIDQLETKDAAGTEVRRRAFKEEPWLKQGEMSSPRKRRKEWAQGNTHVRREESSIDKERTQREPAELQDTKSTF